MPSREEMQRWYIQVFCKPFTHFICHSKYYNFRLPTSGIRWAERASRGVMAGDGTLGGLRGELHPRHSTVGHLSRLLSHLQKSHSTSEGHEHRWDRMTICFVRHQSKAMTAMTDLKVDFMLTANICGALWWLYLGAVLLDVDDSSLSSISQKMVEQLLLKKEIRPTDRDALLTILQRKRRWHMSL